MIRAIASLAILVSRAAYGQAAAAPRFEVASVKLSSDPSSGSSGINSGHGRIKATNVTAKRCIMGAFGLGPNQIAGGPDWLDSDRFDIEAKSDRPEDGDSALMAMLQTLLAERFKLTFHRETRTISAYVLELAKNGPKLEKAEEEQARTNNGRGLIEARTITMGRFAEVLSRQMDLPVVDTTGLKGAFNLKLEWTPESAKPDAAIDSGLSIFTAIQEQLGLRLQSRKTPVETLVIDHAEKPSEN
jgi:uncharacterized protein (TIGR03435 family)